MSCVLSLTAAAVIAGVTITSASSMAIVSSLENEEEVGAVETMFVNGEILLKTLQQEYDCHVNVVSENEYHVVTNCGNLVYKRENETEAYKLYFDEIEDVAGLLNNIRSFEVDYGRNIQAYTYAHVKENLSEGMEIVDEEVLEDDSLYLTINVH